MSNNSYYIFRHGETFASKGNVDYGAKEYITEILPEGVPAIQQLAEYLNTIQTTRNLTSELLRCVQTSGIVAEVTGKKFERFPLLNEFLEVSFVEFGLRMKKLVAELESKDNQTYLLCTHGAIISALKYLLTTGDYEKQNLMDYPKTGTLIVIKEAGVDLLDFNTT